LSEPAPDLPYRGLFDPGEMAALEAVSPGGAAYVLGMVKVDMEWQAARQDRLDKSDHSTRVLSIWLTMIVVLVIAGMTTAVILAGYQVAGSIFAAVDLVALANVFVNAWKR
jgi:hypothetical protein